MWQAKDEPSLNYSYIVMAWKRSVKKVKFKVTMPRSKVKHKKNYISLYLGAHREFINTYTNHIQRNLQMTLTHILNFQSQLQGQRSNIKTDLPMHTYGIWQCCMPSSKLLLFTVLEISPRQRFCSEGHWVKVKGQICKITSPCITTCHGDVTCQTWAFSELWLHSDG